MVDVRSGNLWAITCYFNPVGYRRRLENYRMFRTRLKVPLVAVELSFDNSFQLACGDADILVQLRSPAVLWQKERLLNLAVKSLPNTCTKVAWLDCDIVFESDEWVERASRALDEFALVHLFHERNELPLDFRPDDPDSWKATLKAQSVVHQLATGAATAEEAATPGGLLRHSTSGLAWLTHRDILEQHGLYDACIIGSGDKAVLSAALGVPHHFAQVLEMNPRRTAHYLAWAEPYFNRVRACVGYIPGRVFHLWHGDLKNRRHQGRHRPFAQFDFDPYADIALDSNGCWRWNSEKREMQTFVRHYFESRKEDGT
jgi:hypothetical protein